MSEARPYSVGVEGLACQTILYVSKVAILLLMYTLCKCSEGHFLFDKWASCRAAVGVVLR